MILPFRLILLQCILTQTKRKGYEIKKGITYFYVSVYYYMHICIGHILNINFTIIYCVGCILLKYVNLFITY